MRTGESLFSRLQIGLAGLVILAFLFVGLFGTWLAPHDPVHQDLARVMQPPAWHPEGSMAHPLGTAMLGQDKTVEVNLNMEREQFDAATRHYSQIGCTTYGLMTDRIDLVSCQDCKDKIDAEAVTKRLREK